MTFEEWWEKFESKFLYDFISVNRYYYEKSTIKDITKEAWNDARIELLKEQIMEHIKQDVCYGHRSECTSKWCRIREKNR